MGLKDGPALIIDHMLTYQLLGMAEFWTALPESLYTDIRTEAEEARSKALMVAMGKTCSGCTSIKTAIQPIHNKMWERLASYARTVEDSKKALEPLVTVIAKRRGYRPVPVIVYYRDETGHSQKFTF